jgi:catechol 2,3-dioxygenase-like lactoylglutathione lyase family enzyme
MHFNSLIPELNVSDFEKSLTFYTQILDFHLEYRRDEDKFAFLSLQQNQLMIEQVYAGEQTWQTGPLEYPFGRGMNLSIEVDSLDVLLQSLSSFSAVARLFAEPFSMDLTEHFKLRLASGFLFKAIRKTSHGL